MSQMISRRVPSFDKSFDKSFASHPKSNCWGKRNTKKAIEVFKGSHTKYYLNCDKCNHESLIALHKITEKNQCAFCSNNSTNPRLCESEDCEMCFTKSFASNPKSEFWSKKILKSPEKY